MEDGFIAHAHDRLDEFQSVSVHNQNTADIIREFCPVKLLRNIGYLAGWYHDAGKYKMAFQEYIKKAIMELESVRRGSVTHSSSGAVLLEGMIPRSNLAAFLQEAIFSHHGLCDCFDLATGELLYDRRAADENERVEVEERFYSYADREELAELGGLARIDLKEIMGQIVEFVMSGGKEKYYGNSDFYLGMYERLLLSLLIDGDRIDTASYMQGRERGHRTAEGDLVRLWDISADALEKYLSGFKGDGTLDECRRTISALCKAAAEKETRLYRLTVPTGTGKTLSSLRFALNHAKKYKKQHIFYIAPFNSIIDQNAQVIRDAVGNQDMVLEHHSNIVHETQEEESQYRLLTENYNCPIIVTSAVQLLDTLFSSKTACVRRMHSLCNSILIFDEVQTIPVKCMKLFNLAVNFLTEFCDTTVVLCSATQPLLDRLPDHRVLPPADMVIGIEKYHTVLKRTEILDKTSGLAGWEIGDLSEFVGEMYSETQQVLVIVNTKQCAQRLYDDLKKRAELTGCSLFHLSTNMCPEHRKKVLELVIGLLKDGKPVICVSTQLVEAGVDISFQCVIRSLAGLDSIIQAAGRCQRHGGGRMGRVIIVRMSKEAENVSRLPDIRQAQDIMETLLYQYREAPGRFHNSLDSAEAIELYYQLYMNRRLPDMEYAVYAKGYDTTLLELLSSNKKIWDSNHKPGEKGPVLKQAFRTAGDLFEVISEDGKVDVVVEYDEHAKALLDQLRDIYLPLSSQQKLLRQLQPYVVGISEQMKRKLGEAVQSVLGGTVLVLGENYYDSETGVSETPAGMGFLGI